MARCHLAEDTKLSFRVRRFVVAISLAVTSHFTLPIISLVTTLTGWWAMLIALVIYASTVTAMGFLVSAATGRQIRSLLNPGDNYKNGLVRGLLNVLAFLAVLAILLFSGRMTWYQFERVGEIAMDELP